METKKYVLGFAFSKDKTYLVLIEKQKPDWQRGKYNGIGGKVEQIDGDDYRKAMIREFKEETGVDTPVHKWHHFATMTFKNDIMGGTAEVFCFRMADDVIYQCRTMESEKIQIFNIEDARVYTKSYFPFIFGQNLIKNLHALIPMAKMDEFNYCELEIV